MCVWRAPRAGRHTNQELVGIHNDSASKSWSKYTTDDKVRKVNYVKVTCNNFFWYRRNKKIDNNADLGRMDYLSLYHEFLSRSKISLTHCRFHSYHSFWCNYSNRLFHSKQLLVSMKLAQIGQNKMLILLESKIIDRRSSKDMSHPSLRAPIKGPRTRSNPNQIHLLFYCKTCLFH